MEGVLNGFIQVAVGLQGADGADGTAAAFIQQQGKDISGSFHAFRCYALAGTHLLHFVILRHAVQDIGHGSHSAGQFTGGLCQL